MFSCLRCLVGAFVFVVDVRFGVYVVVAEVCWFVSVFVCGGLRWVVCCVAL